MDDEDELYASSQGGEGGSDGMDSADEAGLWSSFHHGTPTPTPGGGGGAPSPTPSPILRGEDGREAAPLGSEETWTASDSGESLGEEQANMSLHTHGGGGAAGGVWGCAADQGGEVGVGRAARSRYYVDPDKSGIRCYNCDERGHMQRDCPEPQRRTPCALCGDLTHQMRACPRDVCFNCGAPGHRVADCTMPRVTRDRCKRCGYLGHAPWRCPDLWRQYHAATGEAALRGAVPAASDGHAKAWCYNCGAGGHRGQDCPRPRSGDFNPSVGCGVAVYDYTGTEVRRTSLARGGGGGGRGAMRGGRRGGRRASFRGRGGR